MKVKDKVIVVTGAGSGMGRALTLQLLLMNVKVIGIDVNDAALQETASLTGEKHAAIRTFVVDITNREVVEQFAKDAADQFGAVDGIINNAGIIQPFIKVNDLGFAAIERVMNVNFYGTLNMIKAFLPQLLARPEAHIVNISSMGGFLPVPGQTIYGASKAAVKLLTEGLYAELNKTNVRVTAVFPGAVNTNITKNSGLQSPGQQTDSGKGMKVLPAAKAAQIIIAGMEANRYHVMVGNDAKFMDYFSRLDPKAAAGLISRKMQQGVKF